MGEPANALNPPLEFRPGNFMFLFIPHRPSLTNEAGEIRRTDRQHNVEAVWPPGAHHIAARSTVDINKEKGV